MQDDSANTFKYKSRVWHILPETERTKVQRAERDRIEREKKQKMEKVQQDREKKEREKLLLDNKKKAQKEAEDKQKEEDERRKQDELNLITKLKGKFGNMINNLKANDTNLEFTTSSLDLKEAQVRILVKAVERNKTLRGLVFSRKHISDKEGKDICANLKLNNDLERLEVDGNQLGPQTLTALADLLSSNQSIRSVNLEANDLTLKGKDNTGIENLAKVLESNDILLCLNLANCELDARCSEHLMRMMERNRTIINLDIDSNPGMDLYHVRAIQDYLKRNKKAYDDERYQEFLERKQMWRELNISNIIQANQEAKRVLSENINTRIEAKRQHMETEWDTKLKNEEVQRTKQMAKLEKEALARKKSGKKRGRGKKKG